MKVTSNFDRYGNYVCHACRILFNLVILVLAVFHFVPEVNGQHLAPRWYSELPVSEDAFYAIGECGKYNNKETQSFLAHKLAAFRLAETISTHIKFGIAEELSGGIIRRVSYASVTIDTSLMDEFLTSMNVLDSVQLEDGFHILVSTAKSGQLSKYYRKMLAATNTIPEWVKSPPIDPDYIYGSGSSWKRGISGLEEAERLARLDIVSQLNINVDTGAWKVLDNADSFDEVISKQEFEAQIFNSQVIRRAVDENAVSYVLVRMRR